jgi:cell wall-associated NlpC family hydrolase
LARSTRTFAMLVPSHPLRPLAKAGSAVAAACVLAAILPAAVALADQPKTVAAAQAQIDSLDNQAESASEQFNAAQDRLAKAKLTAQAATATAGRAQALLAAERGQVGAFAAQTYRSGGAGQTMLATVLSTGDPAQAAQKIETLRHLGNQQSDVLRAAQVADLRYSQALKAATQATTAANALTLTIAKQKQHIDALIAQSQQVLNRLSADQRAKLLAAQRAKAAADQAKASAAQAAWNAAHAARPVSRAQVRPALRAAQAPLPVPVPEPVPVAPQSNSGSSIAERAVAAAMNKLGSRYVYGAGGPNTFDCSGLVQWAYRQAGVSTAHYTGAFWNSYRHVSTNQLQPGDLVFFYADKHHVGIYIGGGMMVNAPHTGDVVRVAPVFGGGRDYVGAVRVVG